VQTLREPIATIRRDPFVWVVTSLVLSMLIWLSLARYQGYNAGMFDLGNMAQAIWSATQGQPLLYSRPEGYAASRLAGHVELGYFLIVPLYALLPDPRTLLVFQAVLFVVGGFGAYRLAARRTTSRYAARCVLLAYLLYPTALTSVLFDFHADTLTLPLLMLALDALDQRAWWRYALLLAITLSLKFYLAAVVAGIGVVLLLWGSLRRVGMFTIVAGIAYGVLAFFVIRPLFAHTAAGGVGAVTTNYLAYYFGELQELQQTLGERFLNALIVFGPIMLVAWRGWRWLLPGLPIAAAALISTGPGGAFDFRYHHYAVVVPFLIMALIEGIQRAQAAPRKRGGRTWRGDLGLTAGIVLLCSALLVDIPLNPLFWFRLPGSGLDHAMYGVTARDALKDEFLAHVPTDAPTAASNFLAPHLVQRSTLYLTRYPDEARGPERLPILLPQVDVVVADALFDFFLPIDGGYAGGIDGDRDAIALMLRNPQFGLAQTRDGLLLFTRVSAGKGLQNIITTQPDDGRPALERVGEAIELVDMAAEPVIGQRMRLSYTWRITGGFGNQRYVAVTQIAETSGMRFVHLPSYALMPAWQWQPGRLYTETFEIDLPAEIKPIQLALRTGWYDLASPYAYLTDTRSLFAREILELPRIP
jgi:uncharacterized membrane protein